MLYHFSWSEQNIGETASAILQVLLAHPGRRPLARSLILSGPLGAGKTTLVRHLVAALGGDDLVASPSYVLCHEYTVGPPFRRVEHWDVYRLSALPAELCEEPEAGSMVIVEWGERFPELVASVDARFVIDCAASDETRRFGRLAVSQAPS